MEKKSGKGGDIRSRGFKDGLGGKNERGNTRDGEVFC